MSGLGIIFLRRGNLVHPTEGVKPPEDFYFEAIEDMSVSLSANALQYSLDKSEWVSLPAATPTPTIYAGSKVYLRGNIKSSSGIGTFSATGMCNVGGNVFSLLYGADYDETSTLPSAAFQGLFKNMTTLISASNLILPNHTAQSCFHTMFYGCTNLLDAPALPASVAKNYAYHSMFMGCSSLESAPDMPLDTIGEYTMEQMFKNCTNLKTAPSRLPMSRFGARWAFQNCKSLEVAPVLFSTTTAGYCYTEMFSGCSSLRYVKAMFISLSGTTPTGNWLKSVAAEGVFVKNREATWDVTGASGVPTGWTIEYADE